MNPEDAAEKRSRRGVLAVELLVMLAVLADAARRFDL